ncbi:ribbon-helix-helix protein, CopG family [Hyphomonadaceae bacterium BL14]|nr:ribbon-helix-helix protein, CopG family [Hyphomonadaceae bacterium BL14]
MAKPVPSEPITVRTAKVAEIDALASAMDRSRNYIVNQAIDQYLEANVWQMELIAEGIAAAREGKIIPAEEAFARIEAKHGWSD